MPSFEKKTEQVGIKTTPELKREIEDFCKAQGLTESVFGEAAIKYFLTAYHARGAVNMLIDIQEVLR